MATLREIKKRIRSVQNIGQMTKAMEVVSMTKMRRSQAAALSARPYAAASFDMLKNLLERTPAELLPSYFKRQATDRKALVIITSDKGLVGGFNESVLRKAEGWIEAKHSSGQPYDVIAIGKKAEDFLHRKNIPSLKTFIHSGDFVALSETQPIAQSLIDGFHSGAWQAVDIVYTTFRTTLRQEVVERELLPIQTETVEAVIKDIVPEYGRYSDQGTSDDAAGIYRYEYVFEPNAEAILSSLVEDLLKVLVHHVILESNASEHSARMIAMQNASRNADDMSQGLTLEYNKARQGSITRELTEIIAGAEALGDSGTS